MTKYFMEKKMGNHNFCTLALGAKYHLLARKMAENLAHHFPGHELVVLTENPGYFDDVKNIVAIPFQQKGILHCYHDRRFAIREALKRSETTFVIDVDAQFTGPTPEMSWQPGIVSHTENLIEHVSRYTPERLDILRKIADKLSIDIDHVLWVGESIYVVTRDDGKEEEFVETWGKIALYLELNGVHSGDGNAIGLAAAKVGWIPRSDQQWEILKGLWNHFDASHQPNHRTQWQQWQRRFAFHYRLNTGRLKALKDFDFYYR